MKVIEAIFSVAFVGFSVQDLTSRLSFQSKLLYVTSPEGKLKHTTSLRRVKIRSGADEKI